MNARFARRAALCFATALALSPGCMTPGGTFYSADSHTFVSSEWQPWTVTVYDTRTGQAVWSVDVPVGQQLTVRFREGSGPNENKPDMMAWGFTETGRTPTSPRNQVPVPGKTARRMEPTLRAVPEAPGTPAPAPKAAAAPAQ